MFCLILQYNPNADPPVEARERIDAPTNATFQITDTKLYVSVVTLSTEDDNNFLKQLKSGLKRTIKWNKYRSEMTNQTKNNNLNYLINATFTKSTNCLSFHWKMKMREHLLRSIMYQKLK